jgi:hypothetical protein
MKIVICKLHNVIVIIIWDSIYQIILDLIQRYLVDTLLLNLKKIHRILLRIMINILCKVFKIVFLNN